MKKNMLVISRSSLGKFRLLLLKKWIRSCLELFTQFRQFSPLVLVDIGEGFLISRFLAKYLIEKTCHMIVTRNELYDTR